MSETHTKPDVNQITSKRSQSKYRKHQFPPLRKAWELPAQHLLSTVDPAEYQKQLMDGFQEGVDKGFKQGVEQGKEEGYKDGVQLGYDEGFSKGEKEGKERGKVQFDEAAQPLAQIAHSLQQFLDDYEVRRRKELLQLVEKVTKQVIRCELSLQPTQLLALVDEALTSLPTQPNQIKVLLNPEEFARINDADPEKVAECGLVADASMELGECRIITDTAEMDVGCQHRLEQCMTALEDNLLPEEKSE